MGNAFLSSGFGVVCCLSRADDCRRDAPTMERTKEPTLSTRVEKVRRDRNESAQRAQGIQRDSEESPYGGFGGHGARRLSA